MSTSFTDKNKARTGSSFASDVEFTTSPNLMPATKDVAPYLGRAHAVSTKNQSDVVERMIKNGCHMQAEEITRVLDATGFYVMDNIAEGKRAFDVGFVRLIPVLEGSFPTKDAEFDPVRNRLYVAAIPSQEIRDALADGTPSRELDVTQPRIVKVTWGDGTAVNVLKSGEPVDIYGTGITAGVGDESAELILPDDGGTVPMTVEQTPASDGTQRIVGHLSQAVEPCVGAKIVLHTHGPDSASGLKEIHSASLTVLAGDTPPVEPPEIERVQSDNEPDDTVNVGGAFLEVGGQNILDATEVKLYNSHGALLDTIPMERHEERANTLRSTRSVAVEYTPEGGSEAGSLTVTTDGGTDSHAVTLVSH